MKSTFCPKCSTQLIISERLENNPWIKCPTCNLSFENPHLIKNIQKLSDSEKSTMSKSLRIAVAIIGIIWAIVHFSESSTSNVKIENSGWDGSVIQVRLYLEHNLKDPDSYESIEWGKVIQVNDNLYKVRHRYRAKNSFGGYNIGDKIFSLDAEGNVIGDADAL